MWLLCLFGIHNRSRGRAHFDESGGCVSICRRCGKPMRKKRDGSWSVVRLPRG